MIKYDLLFHLAIAFIIFTTMMMMQSCNRNIDVNVNDNAFTLDQSGRIFRVSPPLRRRHARLHILVNILDQWEPLPPYKSIILANEHSVVIKVILVSETGDKYEANIYGMSNGMLSARFDNLLPKNVYVKEIHLYTDEKIKCREIIWHDYTGK